MKIAVFSDVHGNVPALEAVLDDIRAWEPDRVIVNGDLVSRGPYSLRCLRLIQTRMPACRLLKGNHETYVLSCADHPRDPADPTVDLDRFAQWTAQQLGGAVEEIRGWDDAVDLTDPGGGSAHVTHGSRQGNREGIYPHIDDELLAARIGEPRDLFVGSHTHMPLVRLFNGTLVANTGSVGQPLDGDPRSAYGRFDFRDGRWHAEIARVAYDKAQAERDFEESGFLEQGGPIARLIYLELRESRMLVGTWMRRYLQPVKAGEITVAAAVDAYLQSL